MGSGMPDTAKIANHVLEVGRQDHWKRLPQQIMPKVGSALPGVLSAGEGTLPAESPDGMQMADGDGQCVRGIHGLGGRWKLQKAGHHVLDLLLFRAAITDD